MAAFGRCSEPATRMSRHRLEWMKLMSSCSFLVHVQLIFLNAVCVGEQKLQAHNLLLGNRQGKWELPDKGTMSLEVIVGLIMDHTA